MVIIIKALILHKRKPHTFFFSFPLELDYIYWYIATHVTVERK